MKFERLDPSSVKGEDYPHLKKISKVWVIDKTYLVMYDEVHGYDHFRIKRLDKKVIHNFMVLQEIKNELLGEDRTAIEIYPAKKDLVDGSNTYHLWSTKWMIVPNLKKIYEYKKQ